MMMKLASIAVLNLQYIRAANKPVNQRPLGLPASNNMHRPSRALVAYPLAGILPGLSAG